MTENIDSTTPGGRLIFHVFGVLGQFERVLIREHTKAGLAAVVAFTEPAIFKTFTGEYGEDKISSTSGKAPQ